MSRSRAVPVVLALLAVSTLGVAATSLETTLTTDPDDAIDPSWERLPIGESDAATVLDEMDGEAADGETRPTGADGGAGDSEARTGDDGTGDSTEPVERDGRGDGGASGDLERGSAAGGGSPSATPIHPLVFPSLLLLIVVTVALVYRYRAKLRSLLGLASARPPPSEPPSGAVWPGPSSSNVVDRAWVAMVRRLNPDRPESTTAAECRALARERGVDTAAVDAIATSFERVRYGGVSADEEADRARAALRRLDGGEE